MYPAYLKKMTFLVAIIFTISALTPMAILFLSYRTSATAMQINVLAEDLKDAERIFQSAADYKETFLKVNKAVAELEDKTIYPIDGIQNTLAEKLLEKSGIYIDNYNIKNVPPANKARAIPSMSGTEWKVFDFVHVSLQGTFPLSSIQDVLRFISAQEKLWHIESLQIRPLDIPTDLISRFYRAETEISDGRLAEKSSTLEEIEKRANKEVFQISMSFYAPAKERRQ